MNWDNYIRSLEIINKIKIDSNLKNRIIDYFIEELNLYTEQDMYEHSRKLIQSYRYSKINSYNK